MYKVTKYVLSNFYFILWLLAELRPLNRFRRNIRYFKSINDYDNERSEILKASSFWANRICKKLDVKIIVEGEQNFPEGPLVIVSNHQSYADIPIILASIPSRQIGFVAKQSLRNMPFYGKWIEEIRSIFLKRDDVKSSLKSIEEGITLLKNGFSLAIFPEGTRSKGDQMGAFKKGGLRLATKSGAPIVPISLSGSWKIMEATGKATKHVSVRLFIHDPIHTAGLSKQEINDLSNKVESIISRKLVEWQNPHHGFS